MNNQKGGSLSSDNVNKNMSLDVDCSAKYPLITKNIITAKDIVNNYGSVYKSTGGGISLRGLNVKKFAKSLVDNRVLDLYLKYMGIKILTTTTLVPLALIMGKNLFESAIKNIVKSDQSGGSFLKNKIPVLDDALIGNYLKLTGIAVANVSPSTLIPLGILMVIYDKFINEKTGGRVLLPSKYFNPENNETYVDNIPEHGNSNPNPPTTSLSGGTRLLTGATIPPNVIQDVDQMVRGQVITHNSTRPVTWINNEMQVPTSGKSNIHFNSSRNGLIATEVNVKGFQPNPYMAYNDGQLGPVNVAGSNEGPYNLRSSGKPIPDTVVYHTVGPHSVNEPSSASITEQSKNSQQPPETVIPLETTTDQIHVPKKNVGNIIPPSMAGGGSDWASSQMSRGPINSPGMDESQFRMFTKTADYISNKDLSMGVADQWNANYGINHKTLYNENVHVGNPDGNSSGVHTSQFGNGYEESQDGGSHGEDFIEGNNNEMGPNDLLIDQRNGYADVSSSSSNIKASLQNGGKNSIDTIQLFQQFLDDNASRQTGSGISDMESINSQMGNIYDNSSYE